MEQEGSRDFDVGALADRLVCVVMAGGSGTRFWPLSRAHRPKQLLALVDERTLLRATVDRIAPLCASDRTLVVTTARLGEAIAAVLPELPRTNVVGEPTARNTAPCAAVAALLAMRRRPDAIVALLPADHHVADESAFRAALSVALVEAAEGRITTLGVVPTRPETGFGYIERGAARPLGAFEVARFVEKPDLACAAEYLATGRFDWNAGIFVAEARVLWTAVQHHLPALAAALDACAPGGRGDPFSDDGPARAAWREALEAGYARTTAVSIDVGVMEPEAIACARGAGASRGMSVVPLRAGWSDVGTWRSLWDHRSPGASSFVRGAVTALDSTGSVLVVEPGAPHLTALGLHDLTVIVTRDAVLVCPRDRSQDVRLVVEALASSPRKDLL